MNFEQHRDRIVQLVKHAQEKSPFYKERFSGFCAEALTEESFRQLPLLKKSEILRKETELLTLDPSSNSLFVERTSGTTGEPLSCYKSQPERVKKAFDVWNERKKRGNVNVKSRICYFYSLFEDSVLNKEPIYQVENRLYLSMLDMSPGQLDKYYEALVAFDPEWIYSVPSAIHLMAAHMKERGLDAKRIKSLRYIECVSEMMFDYQYKMLQDVFGPVVYSMYGTRENWVLALTCEKGNFHLLEESAYVEVVNEDENGLGELVVTDFNNTAWPMIRYYVGDLVSLKHTCDCGNASPVIKLTGGRAQQFLQIGEWIANPILFHYIVVATNKNYGDAVRRFLITQVEEDYLHMEIVAGESYSEEAVSYVRSELESLLPDKTRLEITLVDSLGITGNKFVYFKPLKR